MSASTLKLNILKGLDNFSHVDLFQVSGLQRLDQAFLTFLEEKDPALLERFLAYRLKQKPFSELEISEEILTFAPLLETFLFQFFDIEEEAHFLKTKTLNHHPVAIFKKHFILRRIKKRLHQN
ncbi:MAG TPA: hypothetical protein VLH77_03705, partial [Gammaproteobacteria bacterium]|nr:hypothetical protein [Gammaproteobacteria bacterium]